MKRAAIGRRRQNLRRPPRVTVSVTEPVSLHSVKRKVAERAVVQRGEGGREPVGFELPQRCVPARPVLLDERRRERIEFDERAAVRYRRPSARRTMPAALRARRRRRARGRASRRRPTSRARTGSSPAEARLVACSQIELTAGSPRASRASLSGCSNHAICTSFCSFIHARERSPVCASCGSQISMLRPLARNGDAPVERAEASRRQTYQRVGFGAWTCDAQFLDQRPRDLRSSARASSSDTSSVAGSISTR